MHTIRKELEMNNLGRFIVLGVAASFILVVMASCDSYDRSEEHPKKDPSVIETPKAEDSNAEHSKAEEQSTIEHPKAENPKTEHPNVEQPSSEHPQ